MVDYQEILRLKSLGNSQRQIEKMVHSGHHTVSDTLAAAREKGIAWPLDESMTNESFKRFCSLASSSNARSTLNRIMPTSIGNWLNRASPWHYSGNKKFFSVNEAKANDCVIDQYADGICMMKYKGRRVYACFPSLATSFKARPDRFNDPILLLGSHFVVAGEAEAAVEDVPADGLCSAGDIGVGLGAQAAAATDEGVQAVHRLLGHGFSTAVSLLCTIYCSFYVYPHTIYRFSLPLNPCPSNQHSDRKTVTAPKSNRFFNRWRQNKKAWWFAFPSQDRKPPGRGY